MNTKKLFNGLFLALLGISLNLGSASANLTTYALLNEPDFELSFVNANYNSTTDIFTVTSSISLIYEDENNNVFTTSDNGGLPFGIFTMSAEIDSSGELVSNPANTFEFRATAGGSPAIGAGANELILSGSAIAFGFDTAANQLFFSFDATGGIPSIRSAYENAAAGDSRSIGDVGVLFSNISTTPIDFSDGAGGWASNQVIARADIAPPIPEPTTKATAPLLVGVIILLGYLRRKKKLHTAEITPVALAAAISFLGFAQNTHAAPLDLTPDFPALTFNNTGVTTYDASTDEFTVTGTPLALLTSATAFPGVILPTATPPGGASVLIKFIVDDTGALVGGVTGDDLVIVGEVDTNGDFLPDAFGVLLTAEVVAFGFTDNAGFTDTYEAQFQITGGALAPLYGSQDLGVVITSEQSDFAGDFTINFGGEAKGSTGTVDPVTPPGEPNEICVDQAPRLNGDPAKAFWIPGIATDFVFTDEFGTFVENEDGTAELTGMIYSRSNPELAFQVEVLLSDFSATPPDSGSPKLGNLPAECFVPDGPVDPTTWTYYETMTGTLIGKESLVGAEVTFVRTGPSFQIGVGANVMNHSFGASAWFDFTTVSQPNDPHVSLPHSGHGDINVNFFDCCKVIWQETFALPDGTILDSGETAWNISRDSDDDGDIDADDVSSDDEGYEEVAEELITGVAEVRDEKFLVSKDNIKFTTEGIDISTESSVGFSIDVSEFGDMEDSGDYIDTLRVAYSVDGGDEVVVFEANGNFPDTRVTAEGIVGDSLVICVYAMNTAFSECHYFDNIVVLTDDDCVDPTEEPEPEEYCVDQAPKLNGKLAHAFWIPGIAKDFVFSDEFGTFTKNVDGTATLTGLIYSRNNPDLAFTVDVLFSDFTETAPADSPKLNGLPADCFVPSGPIDPDTWVYYETMTGTLSGANDLVGAELTLTRRGPAFQLGEGANLKNHSFGGSAWFDFVTVSQPNSYHCPLPHCGYGDINVNIFDCCLINWEENFDLSNGLKDDDGDTAWWLYDYCHWGFSGTYNEELVVCEGAKVKWVSEDIDISGDTESSICIDICPFGDLEKRGRYIDYVKLYYRIDGGDWVRFFKGRGWFCNRRVSALGLIGDTLEIKAIIRTTGGNEGYTLDNITVKGDSSCVEVEPPPVEPPVEEEICVDQADKLNGDSGHAFWLPGLPGDAVWVFSPGQPGTFTEKPDGTAEFVGYIQVVDNPAFKFKAELFFTGRTDVAPDGSPKKELPDSSYIENGGPIDTSTWRYYESFAGLLLGREDFDGAVVEVMTRGPVFQIGEGANGKNHNFGGSGWLEWATIEAPSNGMHFHDWGHGDINVDFGECVDIP